MAGSAYCEEDPWEYYFKGFGELRCRYIPVGCVLTLAGTGSEMDACAVISRHSENRKMFYYFKNPEFAILNPEFTFSVPRYQMVAGIYDTMSHILEQYLSGTDDNTSDYIAEGLMRSLIVSSRKALADPCDYEARSNIMWTATWALNTLIAQGKPTDWMVHMLGQAVAAYTDATHGHTLSAVSGAYYRLLLGPVKARAAVIVSRESETVGEHPDHIGACEHLVAALVDGACVGHAFDQLRPRAAIGDVHCQSELAHPRLHGLEPLVSNLAVGLDVVRVLTDSL